MVSNYCRCYTKFEVMIGPGKVWYKSRRKAEIATEYK